MNADNPGNIYALLLGVGGGSGLVLIFMRGALLQMKQWRDLVVTGEARYKQKEIEAKTHLDFIQEQREVIDALRVELSECEKDRALFRQKIEFLEKEMRELKERL